MSTKTKVQNAPPTAQETELMKLQSELATRQLKQIDELQPFQTELVRQSMEELQRQGAISQAIGAAVTPEEEAAQYRQDFERSQRLGPIQDELLQLQLETARQGGRPTDEQLALIKEATDRGIESGTADIDLSTKRGIGLISDELANSRGLRLSDSPIMNEAGGLVAGSEDLKANLIRSMRANEASAALNYPLAASQVTSGINLNQQNLAEQTKAFQADLRQRAFQNRLAFTGQTGQSGLGLASASRAPFTSFGGGGQTQNKSGLGLGETAQLAAGAYGLYSAFGGGATTSMLSVSSDRRLKTDIKRIGEMPSGIPIYTFCFIGTDDVHRGVMADEVLPVIPEAVTKDEDGYYMVRYDLLR